MITIRLNKNPKKLEIGSSFGRAYLCKEIVIKDGHTSLYLGNTGITEKITDIVDIFENVVIDKVTDDYIVFQISWKNRGILDNIFYPGDEITIWVEKQDGRLNVKKFNLEEFTCIPEERLIGKGKWGRPITSKLVRLVYNKNNWFDLPISTDNGFNKIQIVC